LVGSCTEVKINIQNQHSVPCTDNNIVTEALINISSNNCHTGFITIYSTLRHTSRIHTKYDY